MRVDAKWGDWLRDKRKAMRLNRRELAALAGCDPSYITLFEAGRIPSRKKTEALGVAVRALDEALVMAGFMPDGLHSLRILRLAESDEKCLVPELRKLIGLLKSFPHYSQRDLAAQMTSFVEVVSDQWLFGAAR